jgi:hypothetical protein
VRCRRHLTSDPIVDPSDITEMIAGPGDLRELSLLAEWLWLQ